MAYTSSCQWKLLGTLSTLLLSSMLLPVSAEEPPSEYHVDLIHVDANGSFTRDELIRRAVERSHARAVMLSATPHTESPAYSDMLHYSQYEYLMKLGIGTQQTRFYAVADTGSQLIWTKNLSVCTRRTSSSFSHVACPPSCSDERCSCKRCSVEAMCDSCCDGVCMFKKTYGSGRMNATGFVGNDTLTFSANAVQANNITFGCAIDCGNAEDPDCHLLMPSSAQGIVGLSRGPKSLVSQLQVNKFSYCLNSALQPHLKSRLRLGNDLSLAAAGEKAVGVQTTPLKKVDNSYGYYVELVGISIDNKPQQPFPKEAFKTQSENGKGVLLVDSGMSFSILEKTAFDMLTKLLADELPVEPSKNNGMTCFPATSSKPEIVLYFTGAEMHLPWDNYMWKYESQYCLAINVSSGPKSILGNFQQQNIHMLFDLTTDPGKLSFVPANCG